MNTLTKIFTLFIFLTVSVFLNLSYADTKQKTKNDKNVIDFFEFEELTIKAKIHEPEVLFILDKPDIVIQPFESEIDFTEKIDDVIVEDILF